MFIFVGFFPLSFCWHQMLFQFVRDAKAEVTKCEKQTEWPFAQHRNVFITTFATVDSADKLIYLYFMSLFLHNIQFHVAAGAFTF